MSDNFWNDDRVKEFLKDNFVPFSAAQEAIDVFRKSQEQSADKEPLLSIIEVMSCCHDDSAGGGILYLHIDKLKELVKEKTKLT